MPGLPGRPGTTDARASGSTTHTAAIVGGVVGGVAFTVVLVAALFYFLRIRRRRVAEGPSEKLDVDPGEPSNFSSEMPLFIAVLYEAIPDHDIQPFSLWAPGVPGIEGASGPGSERMLASKQPLLARSSIVGDMTLSSSGSPAATKRSGELLEDQPVVQTVDSGLSLTGGVVLPPPYTHE